jgi:hypothetical protein
MVVDAHTRRSSRRQALRQSRVVSEHTHLILNALLPCCSEKNSFSIREKVAAGSSSMTPPITRAATATAASWVEEGQAAAGATRTKESQGTRRAQERTRRE